MKWCNIKSMQWENRTGFTLIELLVVVAIITMMLSVLVIQFTAYRMRVRDVERERNMKELQKALELYVTTQRVFPEAVHTIITGTDPVSATLIDADAIQAVSPDPLNSGAFIYTYDSPSGKTYAITYMLETDSIPGKSKGLQTVTP